MNALFEFLKTLLDAAKPWAVIEPWEQGVRVRFGKHIKAVGPGVHFQIPFFDAFHARDIKPRVINLPNQTVRTSDKRVLTVSAAMAYHIMDILKTYIEVFDHEESLINLAMGLVAKFVASHPAEECTVETMQVDVVKELRREAKKWGIEVNHLYMTDLAEVKVLRLLQDGAFRETGSKLQLS